MKKILFLLALITITALLPLLSFGQGITQFGLINNKGTVHTRGAFEVDSIVILPKLDTIRPSWLPAEFDSSLMVFHAGMPYFYDGDKWFTFTLAGADSTIYATQYQVDTAKANIYAAIAGGSADSSVFATLYRLDTTRTRINADLLLRVKYSDTAAMLAPYLREVDTTAMLSVYLRKVDTATLSTRIDARVKYTDTAAMLAPYLKEVDTTAMLSPYAHKNGDNATGPWPISITGSAPTWTTGRTIAITGDLAYTSPSFNGSANVTAAGTLATVNANVGTWNTITINAKGLATAGSNTTYVTTEVDPVASAVNGVLVSDGVTLGAAINSDLPVMSATVSGAVPTPPNNTTTFLRGDATWGTVATMDSTVFRRLYLPNAISTSYQAITTQAGTASPVSLSTGGQRTTANGLGVTQDTTKGISLANYTAAAAGAQQISPALQIIGQGWSTNSGGASMTVRWIIDNLGVQGSAAPSSILQFKSSINNAATTSPMTLTSAGILTTLNDINCSGSFFGSSNVRAGASGKLWWSTRSVMYSPSDGVILLENLAENDFGRLQFGGTTSSFPALKRSAAKIEVRLADDSGYGDFTAANIIGTLGSGATLGPVTMDVAGTDAAWDMYAYNGTSLVRVPYATGAGQKLTSVVGAIPVWKDTTAVPSVPTIVQSTYTPTVTTSTNMTSTTPAIWKYMRVGNMVIMSGTIALSVTTNFAATSFEIDLPIASNFAATTDASGTTTYTSSISTKPRVVATASIANDTILMTITDQPGGTGSMDIIVTYLVQ